jgi:hypothetical protein
VSLRLWNKLPEQRLTYGRLPGPLLIRATGLGHEQSFAVSCLVRGHCIFIVGIGNVLGGDPLKFPRAELHLQHPKPIWDAEGLRAFLGDCSGAEGTGAAAEGGCAASGDAIGGLVVFPQWDQNFDSSGNCLPH